MKNLKEKAIEMEVNVLKDEKLLHLSSQIKWYKTEAIKLVRSYEDTKSKAIK